MFGRNTLGTIERDLINVQLFCYPIVLNCFRLLTVPLLLNPTWSPTNVGRVQQTHIVSVLRIYYIVINFNKIKLFCIFSSKVIESRWYVFGTRIEWENQRSSHCTRYNVFSHLSFGDIPCYCFNVRVPDFVRSVMYENDTAIRCIEL